MTEEELTDIEHAKKYAEESTSLAISMHNPKAEEIAKWACLYGLTYKNDKIKKLQEENEQLKTDYKVLSCSVGDFGELQENLEEEQRKNNGLEEQIEKMKCCGNCINYESEGDGYCKIQVPNFHCVNHSQWEFAD